MVLIRMYKSTPKFVSGTVSGARRRMINLVEQWKRALGKQ